MLKPAALGQGDTIGVVAPAAAVDEPSLAAGVRVLQHAGFRVRVGRAATQKSGYLAGSDSQRVADLHDMFRDPEIKAIVAARGGYGSGRLLPLLDHALIRQHAKIFVGHSDLTFLLNDLVQRAELVTFHGPMVCGLQTRPEAAAFLLAMLSGGRAGWQQQVPAVVREGSAEGPLAGGCLSVLVATLGTPYALDARGRLLFLEEVNEKPFRIDRMLTHLRQAGILDAVAGVIFGEMSGCVASDGERVSVQDVIGEAFAGAPYPVAFGLPSGHGQGTLTLPFGSRARLAGACLTLLESPVAE
jgi:muramoyltetrapeptide carboxypeptidase